MELSQKINSKTNYRKYSNILRLNNLIFERSLAYQRNGERNKNNPRIK
jgi:hypothetical protein